MMTFVEELLLLTSDENGELVPMQDDRYECAMAGAALMDLAFSDRIDTDLQMLVVSDHTPTGDSMLDRILAKIAYRRQAVDTRRWIRDLSEDEALTIQESALDGLVERGILKHQEKKFPWTSRSQRYVMVDGKARNELSLRIENVLISGDIPDPRDIALISLLDACDILPDVFPGKWLERCHPRLEQLRKMDLIGREVAGAIADVDRTIILALRARSTRFRKLLLALSVMGALATAATLLSPRVPVPDRFGPTFFELLWFDGLWQQWSGYALLGLSGAGFMTATLRKWRPAARMGGSKWWRFTHVVIGICCALVLFVHTGFRMGENLNAALMLSYLVMLMFGALAGISINGASQLRRIGVSPKPLYFLMKLHVIALYPLPALLIIHILIVYMY